MSWNLSLSEPVWLIAVCIIIGLTYAAILYFRHKPRDLFTDYPVLKWLLPTVRALLVGLMCFFLLGPYSNRTIYSTEKPILAIAVDNSLSMQDYAEQSRLIEKLKSVSESVSNKFDIEVLSLGNAVSTKALDSFSFNENASDYSKLISYLGTEYQDRNLNLCLVIGDGIYNKGANPVFKSEELKYPIYSLGLGDTNELVDLSIENCFYNSIAYLGNEFPVQVDLKSTGLANKQAKLKIYQNGVALNEQQISISRDREFRELKFNIKANKLGANKIEIKLESPVEDQNAANNQFVFYVDVIESRKKVELWTSVRHPDIGALNFLIAKNDNYSFDFIKATNNQKIDDQDLVILYDWFGTEAELVAFESLKSKGIPCLIVIGQTFRSGIFNKGSQDVKFNSLGNGTNQATPLSSSNFEYFDMDEELISNLEDWSPLTVPFGKFSGYKEGDIVLKQKIGTVETSEPLMLLRNEQNYRYGIIAGRGLWQWRILDYQKNLEHRLIQNFVNQTLQYLSVKQNKKLLNVNPSKKVASSTETVVLKAELYNQSLESVSNAEIQLSIKSEKGNEMERVMTSATDKYSLKLSNLEAGTYTYVAKTVLGGQEIKDNGYFTIVDNPLELMNRKANFDVLEAVSAKTGGQLLQLSELESFVQDLLQSDDYSSVIKEENKWTELINLKLIFWLFIILLSIEWFSRKFIGSY